MRVKQHTVFTIGSSVLICPETGPCVSIISSAIFTQCLQFFLTKTCKKLDGQSMPPFTKSSWSAKPESYYKPLGYHYWGHMECFQTWLRFWFKQCSCEVFTNQWRNTLSVMSTTNCIPWPWPWGQVSRMSPKSFQVLKLNCTRRNS